ncbi:MAG: helix-turn-helix transcriptional regulator [Mycobacteriales bacterium]
MVGRSAELVELARFLADASDGPVTLGLHGPAGAGKSTLVEAARRLAHDRGLRVLVCRPAQSESALSFTALADLLGDLEDDVLATLPGPQRRALDVVLLRADPDPGAPAVEPRAVGTAVLTLVRAVAADAPVLLAVDDLQWLDPASARALEFVLRRLEGQRIGILTSMRSEQAPPPALGLDRVLPVDRQRQLLVGPLSLGALHHLVHDAFDRPLPRPTLVQLAQVSGGNPFYALEIARALQAGAPILSGDSLPVPETLRELVAARIAALPMETRATLLVAAVAAVPTVELLLSVSGDARAALEPAIVADVVDVEDGRLRFTHPLLTTAVRSAAGAEQLAAVHRRLSSISADPEERARHLALSSTEPDDTAAAALESAAETARRRGAPDVAAELGQQSLRLTPPGDGEGRGRRSLAVAEYLLEAGDSAAARELITHALESLPSSPVRANGLLLLGTICWFDGDPAGARTYCELALREPCDRVLSATVHSRLATFCEEIPEAARHAEAAVRLLDEQDDAALRSFALFGHFWAEALSGRPPRLALLDEALRLEPRGQSYETSSIPGLWAKYVDDFPLARERFLGMLRQAVDVGDESTPPDVLPHLAELELWEGDWSAAREHAAEAAASAEQTGQDAMRALRVLALVDAHEGQLDIARTTALPLLRAAEDAGDSTMVSLWRGVLGFVDLSAGRAVDADRWFSLIEEHLAAIGMREPLRFRHGADHVEAVLAIGDLARAEALLSRLEQRGRTLPRPWITATSSRCRGLLAAARGDLDSAENHLAAALRHCEVLPIPFEVARTHLVSGQIHRRRRAKRAAAESLQTALLRFEALGAVSWAQLTRAELRRVGLRPAAPLELTETERRVAELVATGRTNRDVASALFVSPKTVEANLARAYQKLGIRSRAELGAAMREPAGHSDAESPS